MSDPVPLCIVLTCMNNILFKLNDIHKLVQVTSQLGRILSLVWISNNSHKPVSLDITTHENIGGGRVV